MPWSSLPNSAGKNIYEMDFMGYPYNRQEDGHFHQRKMGGSSHARAAYYEDRSGHAMVHALFEQCLAHDIDFISECQMLEISMDGETLNGVIALDMRSGHLMGIPARSIIIATGGYWPGLLDSHLRIRTARLVMAS
jgi:succinate dehydrogenase / fumarate reductase flavoprotein subunit